ncbi:MAG: hypothetical protein O7B35_10835 [Deltaproteobacteria bacterium]|nr:hypothetical protein [Deltaproteobacteria bacterium]
MIKAQLALIAEVGNASQVPGTELFGLPIYRLFVETVKEVIERGAKVEAATTAVTDIENALKLPLDLGCIPERFGI